MNAIYRRSGGVFDINQGAHWRRLAMALILMAAAVLQTGLEATFTILDQVPNLVLVILVGWAVRSPSAGLIFAAFAIGIGLDLLGGTVAGGQSMALMLAILPVVQWRFVLFGSSASWLVVASAFATAIYNLVFGLLLVWQGIDLVFALAALATVTAIILNTVLAVAIFWIGGFRSSVFARRTKLPVRPGTPWR